MTKFKNPSVPDYLIYEMDEGNPIYYRGYKKVLNKTKTAEQIMGSSALQSLIVSLLLNHLSTNLASNYLCLASELGFLFKKKSWRSLDIAIYDLEKVSDKSIFLENTYIKEAPKIVIEVDTKADLENLPYPSSYFQKKTDQLLQHGVDKVIWIFTATQKILVAEKDTTWTIDNWTKDIIVLDEISINIGAVLKKFS